MKKVRSFRFLEELCCFLTLCVQIATIKKRLEVLKRVALDKYGQEHADRIPSPDGIDLQKLVDAGCMSDNCSVAQSMQRKFIANVNGTVYQMHCFEHMFNTLLNRVNKDLQQGLRTMVNDNANIDPTLRCTTSPVLYFQAMEKDLAPTCNYVKGHGLDITC